MKWKNRRVNHKGVTIFEVMIAIALFAIIITPVMRSFITSMRVNQKARRAMIATDVAQTIMEGISGKSYEQVYYGLTAVTVFLYLLTTMTLLVFTAILMMDALL